MSSGAPVAKPSVERPSSGDDLAEDPYIGRELGGYRLARRIGFGGMASVYLSYKAGPGGFAQPAALKVIHPHMAMDREFVEMFLDEARLASCIGHPNVCRVMDFGKASGTYYLAMEHLMGETWDRVIRTLEQREDCQTVLPEFVAHVLSQACEGLHAAHEASDASGKWLSIVHRDVSPHNLFVGYDGSVRLLDFGIASATERLHTTRAGTIKGRFAYMAPEQMQGKALDRRADVWSLGVLLREGLTGRCPFRRGTDAETILAVTREDLPPWEVEVPQALQVISERALQRDLDSRYASAREMGRDLARFVNSQVVLLDMPEAGLWMNRLFATRIEEKRAMLQEAASHIRGGEQPLSWPAGEQSAVRTAPPTATSSAPPPTHVGRPRRERAGAGVPPLPPLPPLPPPRITSREAGQRAGSASATARQASSEPNPPGAPGTAGPVAAPLRPGEESGPAPESAGLAEAWIDTAPIDEPGLTRVSRPVDASAHGEVPAVARRNPAWLVLVGTLVGLAVWTAWSWRDSAETAVPEADLAGPQTSGADETRPVPPPEPPPVSQAPAAQLPSAPTGPASAPAAAPPAPPEKRDDVSPKAPVADRNGREGRDSRNRSQARRDSERRRAAVVRPPGTLNVVSRGGWAEVYLGRKRLGTTPGRFQLPAGRHTLRLQIPGREGPLTRRVTVKSGESSRLVVDLRR